VHERQVSGTFSIPHDAATVEKLCMTGAFPVEGLSGKKLFRPSYFRIPFDTAMCASFRARLRLILVVGRVQFTALQPSKIRKTPETH
jgi:hypothetical protein